MPPRSSKSLGALADHWEAVAKNDGRRVRLCTTCHMTESLCKKLSALSSTRICKPCTKWPEKCSYTGMFVIHTPLTASDSVPIVQRATAKKSLNKKPRNIGSKRLKRKKRKKRRPHESARGQWTCKCKKTLNDGQAWTRAPKSLNF